ncbi:MAG: hypothetical protein NT040_10465 [Bacteroidetes bacterium]|nr:hypothetical protein [Bacteroidota bacterium]
MNIKAPGIIAVFLLACVGFIISLILQTGLPPLIFLILTTSGFGVLILLFFLLLNYIKNETIVMMKSNELSQKKYYDEKQETQYKEGLSLRTKETEFHHSMEILRQLCELKKTPSIENTRPTENDVKNLKDYLDNHNALINQISKIINPKLLVMR